MTIVWPSGAARATRPTPMLPLAPATFSMMMLWPSDVLILSAKMRPSTSSAPPAGNGTTTVIGRVGKACALATRVTAGSAAVPAAKCKNRRRVPCMFPSASEQPARLLGLDVGRPDDLGPHLDLDLDAGRELLRRARDDVVAERGEPLFHVRLRQDFCARPIERRDDVRGRTGRN